MPNVFTIYETEPYQEELVKLFAEIGLNVFQININQLHADKNEARESDLFLIDMTRFSGDKKYLNEIQEIFPEKPIILTHMQEQVTFAELSDYDNIIDFISQPISIPDLAGRILNAWNGFISELSTGSQEISGSLHDQNLVNLIQTFASLRQSGVIQLDSGKNHGTVTFTNGKLINARYKNLVPNKSLAKMILWSEGIYKIEFAEVEGEDHIREDIETIISDGLERLSKYIEKKEKLPDGEIFSITQYNPENFDTLELDILQFFVPGKTVSAFMSRENADDFDIVEKLVRLFEKEFLFISKDLRDEADEKNKGIGKIFSRLGIFTKEEKVEIKVMEKKAPKAVEKTETGKAVYKRRFAVAQLNEIKDKLIALL